MARQQLVEPLQRFAQHRKQSDVHGVRYSLKAEEREPVDRGQLMARLTICSCRSSPSHGIDYRVPQTLAFPCLGGILLRRCQASLASWYSSYTSATRRYSSAFCIRALWPPSNPYPSGLDVLVPTIQMPIIHNLAFTSEQSAYCPIIKLEHLFGGALSFCRRLPVRDRAMGQSSAC